jgi:2-oxoglutarate ferredoxin oxidoreductase subunit alpha
MFVATGLCHDEGSKVTYAPEVNQKGCEMRSRKIAVFQQTLLPPPVVGPDEGDLLLLGWGSTKGAIEEAAERARAEGLKVSSAHLSFLAPLQPGLPELCRRFRKAMTVEINYSDRADAPFVAPESRRLGQLAYLLRGQLLLDVDCWTRVPGEPLRPGRILEAIREKLGKGVAR